MKRFLVLTCALLCAASAVAADLVVRDGEATAQSCFRTLSKWKRTDVGLTGTGTDNPIMAGNVYRPDAFEVEATLAFAKLDGGAARVFVGDVVCGIDGSSHHFFLESPAGSRSLGTCGDRIVPGKPFKVRVRGEKGTYKSGLITKNDKQEDVFNIRVRFDADKTYVEYDRFLRTPNNFIFGTSNNLLYKSEE